MKRSCWCAFAMLGLVACGGGEAAEPSVEDEQDKLEDFWSDPGKADLVGFGTAYVSDYVNMGLSGRASKGDESVLFTLFAGWHTDDFPWPNAESWVSVGLLIDGRGYSHVSYDSNCFRTGSFPREGGDDFTLRFDGVMSRASGQGDVAVAFELDLDAVGFDDWHVGLAQLGMNYRPALLRGGSEKAGGVLVVGDTTYELDPSSVVGEVEQGHVFGINYRGAFFKYDYCSLSNPDTGKAFTSFVTKTLTEEGNPVLAKASKLLQKLGSKTFSLDRARDYEGGEHPCADGCEGGVQGNPDNPEQLYCPEYGPEGVLFEHRVDLGKHAALKRQMFHAFSADGIPYIGLREVFLPKTNAWGWPCRQPYCGDLPPTE